MNTTPAAGPPTPDALRSDFPGWLIESRCFQDGWNLCAWRQGRSTTGRMSDITRRTEAELREAITAVMAGTRP